MIYEKSATKVKGKIQLTKAINSLSNILSVTSPIRDQIQKNIEYVIQQKIERPHKTMEDTDVKKKFIITDFNQDKKNPECYRSPHTNKYFPINNIEQAIYPSPILRQLQEKGNILFKQYAKLYYGEDSCISNFYVHESQQGLNVVFVLQKEYKDEDMKGLWCATNIFEIRGDPAKSVAYKLQTSILYDLHIRFGDDTDFVKFSGNLKKNKVQARKPLQQYEIDQFHLMVCGKLVQQTQTLLRQQLESIFLIKTNEIIANTRFSNTKAQNERKKEVGKKLMTLRNQSQRVVQ